MLDLDLTVCIDCALLIANDDLSAFNPEGAEQHRAAYAAYQDGTEGHLIVHPIDDETDFDDTECAGCGTTLYGTRVPATRVR